MLVSPGIALRKKCLDFFDKKLGLKSIQIEWVHRVGQRQDGCHYIIITKLWSYKDHKAVLNKF